MKVAGHDSAHVWEFFEKGTHPDAWWRHYRCDGRMEVYSDKFAELLKIVSVTQVNGTLAKDNLVGWAANTDIAAVYELARKGTPWRRCLQCRRVTLLDECDNVILKKGKKGRKTLPDEPDTNVPCPAFGFPTAPYRLPNHWRALQKDIKDAGLEHDAVKDKAAFRGTSIHTLHEEWVREHTMPNPMAMPEAWRGFVQAYAKWLMMMDRRGARFESVEQIVGSATYGFAGSCDTVAIIEGPDGKRERWDFKTSKQVYARTNFRQLAGYELADVEMGNPPTDSQHIAVLRENGDLVTAESTEGPDSFLEVLAVFRRDQPLIKLDDAAYKARTKAAKA